MDNYSGLLRPVDPNREEPPINSRKRHNEEQYVPLIPTQNRRPLRKWPFSLVRLPINASPDMRVDATNVLWRAVNEEPDKTTAFAHYLSFISVMIPELRNDIELCVRSTGYLLTYNDFPNSFVYAEYQDDETEDLTTGQGMIYLGVTLLVPFKNITGDNYRGYFSRGISALCNMLGGDVNTLSIPFSVEKCMYFKSQMNQFDLIRKKIVRFLISDATRAETVRSTVAKYILSMISWSEMTGFKFVMDALVMSVSPVLLRMDVASEVNKFFDITDRVFASSHPQLYRFLANEGELMAMGKSQFPVLYAVSYSILSEQHASIKQLFGPTNVSPKVVQELVSLHKTYVQRTMMISKKAGRRLPDMVDPDIKQMALHMQTFNMSGRELIQLKTFNKRPQSVASSHVRDTK